MKIKALINLLNKLPQDMEIEGWDAEWDIGYTIKNLKLKYVIVDKSDSMITHKYFDEMDEEYEEEINYLEKNNHKYSVEKIRVID